MLRFFGLLGAVLVLVSGFYNIHEHDTGKEETATKSGDGLEELTEGPDNSAVGCYENGAVGFRYFAPGDTW